MLRPRGEDGIERPGAELPRFNQPVSLRVLQRPQTTQPQLGPARREYDPVRIYEQCDLSLRQLGLDVMERALDHGHAYQCTAAVPHRGARIITPLASGDALGEIAPEASGHGLLEIGPEGVVMAYQAVRGITVGGGHDQPVRPHDVAQGRLGHSAVAIHHGVRLSQRIGFVSGQHCNSGGRSGQQPDQTVDLFQPVIQGALDAAQGQPVLGFELASGIIAEESRRAPAHDQQASEPHHGTYREPAL